MASLTPDGLRPQSGAVLSSGFQVRRFSPRHPLLPDRITSLPKEKHGLVLIVRPTSELDVSHGRRSAVGVRHDMVEFEEGRLGTATCAANERAAPLVAPPDLALYGRGHMPGGAAFFKALPRPDRGATPSLLDIGEEQGQGAIEDRSDVAVGDGVPQQVPGGGSHWPTPASPRDGVPGR
jgi:hypothetical protein